MAFNTSGLLGFTEKTSPAPSQSEEVRMGVLNLNEVPGLEERMNGEGQAGPDPREGGEICQFRAEHRIFPVEIVGVSLSRSERVIIHLILCLFVFSGGGSSGHRQGYGERINYFNIFRYQFYLKIMPLNFFNGKKNDKLPIGRILVR